MRSKMMKKLHYLVEKVVFNAFSEKSGAVKNIN